MAFSGWGRKCALVIQSSQVASTLTNFPLLLTKDTLPSEMFDADGSYPALSTGGDIRFSSDSAGNTQLPCEIEYFVTDNDPANGKAVIWVKVASISSSANTTIYVWYNKSGESQPGRATTYGLENVWNSNYKLVMHLNQSPTNAVDEILDSTSNLNHGQSTNMSSTNLVDGQHGKCLNFAGNQYIRVAHHSSLSITPDLSVQIIGYPTNVLANYGNWIGKDRSQNSGKVNYRICFDGSTTYITFFQQPTAGWQGWRDSVVASDDTWYNITATKAGTSNPVLYRNNNSVGTCAIGGSCNLTLEAADSNDVMIGAVDISGDTPPIVDYFVGKLDQIRIVDTNFSADWVDAEYKNWTSPSTFTVEGTPQSILYLESLTESFTSNDSLSAISEFLESLSESFTSSDNVLEDLFRELLTESFTSTDSISTLAEYLKTILESFTSTDTLTKNEIIEVLLSESFTSSDSVLGIRDFIKSISENFTSSDSILEDLFRELLSESFTSDDSISVLTEYSKTILENFTSTDSIVDDLFVLSLIESFTSMDTLTKEYIFEREFTESFVVDDTIDGFNWSEWLRENGDKAIKNYYLTLTGAEDSLSDYVLPMKSFQGRSKNGEPTYLSCVIPCEDDYVMAINNRPNGSLIVEMAYIVNGVEEHKEVIIQVDLESVRIDEGSVNKSITLSGHRTESTASKHVIIKSGNYYSLNDGKYNYRITPPDLYLKPGDTLEVDDNTFTVGNISYIVSVSNQRMEVAEAE